MNEAYGTVWDIKIFCDISKCSLWLVNPFHMEVSLVPCRQRRSMDKPRGVRWSMHHWCGPRCINCCWNTKWMPWCHFFRPQPDFFPQQDAKRMVRDPCVNGHATIVDSLVVDLENRGPLSSSDFGWLEIRIISTETDQNRREIESHGSWSTLREVVTSVCAWSTEFITDARESEEATWHGLQYMSLVSCLRLVASADV